MNTDEQRKYLQRVRGLCSNRECDEPIAGYIIGGRKLCNKHLYAFLMAHSECGAFLYPPLQEGGMPERVGP